MGITIRSLVFIVSLILGLCLLPFSPMTTVSRAQTVAQGEMPSTAGMVPFAARDSMDIPDLVGSIAYVELNADGYTETVKRIDPDGSNPQTLWTYPGTLPLLYNILDVAWKPDGTELAFSSTHESAFSAFNSDVYGIRPDGSGLRRITNPPSKAEIDAGGYQFGGVTGSILNNYHDVASFLVYVEGAKSVISANVGFFGDVVGFTVPEVADLGIGLHYVVFIWADGTNANCREYAAAVVDVEPGKTVDAGQLSFSGTCGKYNSESISWKRDGSQVGVDVITPRKFQATGQAIGTEMFSGASFADKVAWSPTNDQILYQSSTTDPATSGIYLTTDGGGAGNRQVADSGALWVTSAWLPDGSGFVFTIDHEIWQYIGGQLTGLLTLGSDWAMNPSVSPDGNYVVFEYWRTNGTHDLAIFNRTNPNENRFLTTDGRSTDPDWSRVDPTVPTCTALTGVTISGDTNGSVSQDYTFKADTSPANAATPINYTWTPTPKSGAGTAQATYNWSNGGSQQVKVEVSNCSGAGTAQDTHDISISATCTPLTGVTISGPTTGFTGRDYEFTAGATPASATGPLTYSWTPSPDSGQNTARAHYQWSKADKYKLSVTVTNCSGSGNATANQDVTVRAPTFNSNAYLPHLSR